MERFSTILFLVFLLLAVAAASAVAFADEPGNTSAIEAAQTDQGDVFIQQEGDVAPGVGKGSHGESRARWEFFGIDKSLAAWTLINFLFLLVVLNKFAWKPIMKNMEKRAAFIAEKMQEAETKENKAREHEAKWREKLENADLEAHNIVEKNKSAAYKEQDKIITEAREAARGKLRKAEVEADVMRKEFMDKFGVEVTEVVTELASKIACKEISPVGHEMLVKKYIKDSEIGKESLN